MLQHTGQELLDKVLRHSADVAAQDSRRFSDTRRPTIGNKYCKQWPVPYSEDQVRVNLRRRMDGWRADCSTKN